MGMTCGRYFNRRDAEDPDGCILPDHHEGMHVFVTPAGRKVEWELDATCDCEDCQGDDTEDWCKVYRYIDQTGPEG